MLIGDGRGVWTCGACELTVAHEDKRLRTMARETHLCRPPEPKPKRRRR
jgi:hypothetical protein